MTGETKATFTITSTLGSLVYATPFSAPRSTPLTSVIFATNSELDLASVDAGTLTLTRDGNPVDLTGATIEAAPPAYNQAWYESVVEPGLPGTDYTGWMYRVTLPASVTSAGGNYQLTVNGPTVTTKGNNAPINNSVSTTWTSNARISAVTQFSQPRTTPLTSVFFMAGFGLDLSSFDISDIQLTRDGNPITPTGATVVAAGPGYPANGYFLQLPAALTSAPGEYSLTIQGAGLMTANGGSVYGNNGTTTWLTQGRITSISSFGTPSLIPTTAVVVTTSCPLDLSLFNVTQMSLTRNGEPVDITGMTINAHATLPNVYIIRLPLSATGYAGSYELTVNGAGTLTEHGVAVGNNISTSWVNQAKFVYIPTYPVPRTTPMTEVKFTVSVQISMGTFDPSDLQLTLDGTPLDTSEISLDAAPDDYSIGTYVLSIPETLTGGNGTYVLTLPGSSITTGSGKTYVNDMTTTWSKA